MMIEEYERMAAVVEGMNADDLLMLSRAVAERLESTLSDESAGGLEPGDVLHLPVRVFNDLHERGVFVTTTEARKALGKDSRFGVHRALRSPIYPLKGAQIGGVWFFTRRWIEDYDENRTLGRPKK